MPEPTSRPPASRREASNRFQPYAAALDERRATDRLRAVEHLRPEPGTPFVQADDGRLLNFSSNDYLGLATDPDVIAGAAQAARDFGAGSGSSRLVSGSFEIHRRLEQALAEFTGRRAGLLFVSGFQANACLIPSLVDRHGLVLCDKLVHASVLHGCRVGGTRYRRFRHNDLDHLDALAREWRTTGGAGTLAIVTESVFSMDGDRAPLEGLCEIADRHDALLIVDDAHAIGVFGPEGRGLAAGHERVDVVLGTFGKAFGSSGAFVATREVVREQLVNFCDGTIYSTAPAPPVLGAVEVALAKIRSGGLDQEGFLSFAARARDRLREAGFDTAPSDTQIVPIRMGEAGSSVAVAKALRDSGVLAVPIRPPTVPEGTARLRISLTRLHTLEHVDTLAYALDAATTARASS